MSLWRIVFKVPFTKVRTDVVFQQQMSKSSIYYGDLCELQVDAIVNAANSERCWDVLFQIIAVRFILFQLSFGFAII